MRLWCLGVLGLVAPLAFSGCEAPTAIGPVTPPGANIPRESPDTDPAQARGEMAVPGPKGGATDAAKTAKAPSFTASPTAKGETKKTPGGVTYETLKEGTGPEIASGQTAEFHYVGKLDDGTEFDSSRKRGKPLSTQIGTGEVIAGWDEAVPGMKVGEVRKMTIPPDKAYGAAGRPGIPPNSTLTFEIELLGVK